MIDLLSEERCVQCGICVDVCPTNVFDGEPGATPIIARPDDCQTCWMCEAYCPVDALYVSPFAELRQHVEESALVEAGLLGSYRRDIGWGKGRTPQAKTDRLAIILRQNAR
jgi:NAD-dependent dihydropyrimidine dehydrogenase PreA subunit